jgi:DNA-binding CsgD family transcriptional regulator
MYSPILFLTFLFCLAIAVGSLLMARQLTATYDKELHRHYFYYLIAFYAFAFYGLWGPIVARALLSSLEAQAAVVQAVSGFLSVLGVPFLFLSWLMLLTTACSLFEKKARTGWLALHAAVFVALLVCSWALLAWTATPSDFLAASVPYLGAGVLIVLELVYFAAFLVLAIRFGKRVGAERREVALRFALLLFAAFCIRTLLGGLVLVDERLGSLSLLAYFGSNLLPVLYLRAVSDKAFEPVKAELASAAGMEAVFERYGITKRERQIVQHVCLGKTNKQIADELFISLQTVKDHTHRIYSKMGINSRMKLVQIMNSAR